MPKPSTFGPIPSVNNPSYRATGSGVTSNVRAPTRVAEIAPQAQATRRFIIDLTGIEDSFSVLEIDGVGFTAVDQGNGRLRLTLEGVTPGSGEIGQTTLAAADGTNVLSADEAAKGILVIEHGTETGAFDVRYPDIGDDTEEACYRLVDNTTAFDATIQTSAGTTVVIGAGLSQLVRFSTGGVKNGITGV